MFAEVPQLSNCPPNSIVADLCQGGCPRCDANPGTACYCDTECALAGDCCCEECGTSETAETERLIGLCPSPGSQAQKPAAPTSAPIESPPTQAPSKSASSKSDFGMFAEVPQLSNCPPNSIVADLCQGGCPRCDANPGTACYCDTECALAGDCCCEECGTSETAETERLIGLCPSPGSQAQKPAAPTTAPTESPQSSQSVESESPSTTPKPTLLKTSKPTPSSGFGSFDFDLASSDEGLPGTMPMPPAPAPAPE